ncbi:MAG: energy transducer TonB [Melioribacteraceae bacterium]|nr:energy transducer TonB [Melioribacteraceae bacterium]
MNPSYQKKISYLISVGLHLLIMLLFVFVSFNTEQLHDEFVTIGFGTFGNVSTAGVEGITPNEKQKIPDIKKEESKEITEEKEIDLPEVVNKSNEPVKTETDDNEEKEVTFNENVKPIIEETENTESTGAEKVGDGTGNFGFEIDFGGKGIRKIYSHILPEYPEGVSKEIDIKLRFTILPDGTVGNIFPMIKADARLETAAINSLRQWRFEPLPESGKDVIQSAVIVFPYRLR